MTVNLLQYIYLARLMVPVLLARAKKTGKRCSIVSTSSVCSMTPIPNKITYGATKAFVQYMSEALAVEVKDHIDVMSMHPGLVSSNMCQLPPGG
jgi:short-subunit dehydrogenase